ncbi:MAG: hypothetical protein ACI31S_05030 [Bacilli bacterium]
MEKDKEERKEEKRGIFLGIIGVLTLIVAIIGASFAYFSINAKSKENALTVNAASVQIVYDDGNQVAISNLIPSTKAVAEETVRRAKAGESNSEGVPYQLCKDDKGYTVCGMYEFTLTNNGDASIDFKATVEPTPLAAEVRDEETNEIITPAEKGFSNLKFVMYDITNSDAGTLKYEGTMGYSKFGLLGDSMDVTDNIAGNGTTKKYRMFIWLDEAGAANDVEQGAVFKGTVVIDVVGAENGQITGTAEGA